MTSGIIPAGSLDCHVDGMCCGTCSSFKHEDAYGLGWCAFLGATRRCDMTCPNWTDRRDAQR